MTNAKRATTLMLMATVALAAGPAMARSIAVAAGPDAQARLQTALIDAKAGDTVRLAAGRFALSEGLSLDVPGVTVRGAGRARRCSISPGRRARAKGC